MQYLSPLKTYQIFRRYCLGILWGPTIILSGHNDFVSMIYFLKILKFTITIWIWLVKLAGLPQTTFAWHCLSNVPVIRCDYNF